MSLNVTLGLNVPDSLPVGNFPTFESKYPLFTDEELKSTLTLPSRNTQYFTGWNTDQNPYNSCCAHAFALAAQRAYWRKYGDKIDLQPHFLYAHINGGRDQGALLVDGAKHLMTTGIPLKKDAPDNNRIYLNQYPNKKELYPKCILGLELYEVRSKQALLTALACRFPCVVAVHVDDNYLRKPSLPPINNGVGNHAICLDDAYWNENRNDYIMTNPGSWGISTGNMGQWEFIWNHFQVPNNYHVFYTIPSVTAGDRVDTAPELVGE